VAQTFPVVMRTRLLILAALVVLGAAPAAASTGASYHLDYVHTWAEPTLGPTAVWNGGNGMSAGFDVPLEGRWSAGFEAVYDRWAREAFYSVPGVALTGGGALEMSSSLVMLKYIRPGQRGSRLFLEAGTGLGAVREDGSRFRGWGSTRTTYSPGERFNAAAFELGIGYRTRPVAGPLHVEVGARWMLLPGEQFTVPDEPIRVGVAL
jgi:hypothetical protein